jgi:hypothetical protein
MTYSKQVVAAIKVAGKVLRETGDAVAIPFGSEYSIFIKNLKSVRIQVRVSIDGEDATGGTWLIVEPNRPLELERFIRNGNFERGNRFKFIERTKQIEEHRGVGAEDGLVRIEYKTEHVEVEVPRIHYYDKWIPVPRPWPVYPPCPPRPRRRRTDPLWFDDTFDDMPIMRMSAERSGPSGQSVLRSANVGFNSLDCAMNETSLDAGITVAGSESNQRFVEGAYFPTEAVSEVIVLHLKGCVGGQKVAKAVTVNHKPTCATCGKKNKGGMQFCGRCGTALTLI